MEEMEPIAGTETTAVITRYHHFAAARIHEEMYFQIILYGEK